MAYRPAAKPIAATVAECAIDTAADRRLNRKWPRAIAAMVDACPLGRSDQRIDQRQSNRHRTATQPTAKKTNHPAAL
ncbi:UNVERIFIED_ORG: hypothetical protein ABIC54_005808 [Burkholderia sp. 1263]